MLARYDALRRADVQSRTLAVDLLNRSLLSDFVPVQSARGLGLYLIDRIAPLRRAVLREGAAPAASQPRLMRGERYSGNLHDFVRAEGTLHALRIVASLARINLSACSNQLILAIAIAFVIAGFVKGVLGQGLPTVAVGLLA